MKTMILAAATVLALSASGAAYAESEGQTAVGAEWAAENGNPQIPATEYFAHQPTNSVPQQAGSVDQQRLNS